MRLFVAIEFSNDLRKDIGRWSHALAQGLPDPHQRLHWVKEEQFHLTLMFLGATHPGTCAQLEQELRLTSKKHEPFSLRLSKTGHFGGRVIWLGVAEGVDPLRSLSQSVVETCAALGFKNESRSFQPHLTLARAKKSPGPLHFENLPQALANTSFGPFSVDRFSLIQSTLTPAGAIYKTLTTFLLSFH